MMNVINGGAHADNSVDLQEFMVVPAGAASFSEALRMGTEVFHALKATLKERGLGTTVGDEGGFAPDLESNEAALEVLVEGIEAAGYEPGADAYIALDPATSELYREADGAYVLEHEGRALSAEEMAAYWAEMTAPLPGDLDRGRDGRGGLGRLGAADQAARRHAASSSATTSSSPTPSACGAGSRQGVGNSILVKVNQIGTLTETLEAISIAREAGYSAVISHRSGETEDTTIADLAVGTAAGQIKTGAPSRSDRVAKYNQLLRIEEELGDARHLSGAGSFQRKVTPGRCRTDEA